MKKIIHTGEYRAWDTIKKQWLDFEDSEYSINPITGKVTKQIIDESGFKHFEDQEHIIPSESTGLKDKSRKEIYEGDIVKDQKKESNIGTVFWHNGQFFLEWTMRSQEGQKEVDRCFEYCEIIGNIYENPELLMHCKVCHEK